MKNGMEKLRQWASASSLRLFSAPYLPSGLIWTAMLAAYTDLMVLLLGQPAGYWIDRGRAASSFPLLQSLLAAGILPYLLAGLLYLALLWLALTVLTRSFALAAWLPFSFVHLVHALSWASGKAGLADASTPGTILAGGLDAAAGLLLGAVLAIFLLKPTRPAAPARRIRWVRPGLFTAWLAFLGLAVLVSAVAPRGGWAPLHPAHTPGPRAISAVAYDAARHKLVLFGGVSDWLGSSFMYDNDTWEWDGRDWTEMKPKSMPPVRAGQAMAYDEKRGVIVLFGGEDKSGGYMLSDTWEWDGSDWKQMFSQNYPTGRRGAQLFYDHATGKMILSGGFYYAYPGKVVTPLDDTWEWDGKEWQYANFVPQNLIITNPNVAYDPHGDRTILFNYNQILAWTDGQWNEVPASIQPPARFGPWLAGDAESGRMLLFGGVEKNVQLNDTWLLDRGAWKQLHPDLSPSPRDAYVMFYDPIRKSFILYGGMSTYALDDMWEFVLP